MIDSEFVIADRIEAESIIYDGTVGRSASRRRYSEPAV
jgi:hypothetical protein